MLKVVTLFMLKSYFFVLYNNESMLIYTANMDVSTVLTPPSSPTCALQHYECAVCKILYKTKSGLTRHNTIV